MIILRHARHYVAGAAPPPVDQTVLWYFRRRLGAALGSKTSVMVASPEGLYGCSVHASMYLESRSSEGGERAGLDRPADVKVSPCSTFVATAGAQTIK
jgi:hypothetical protein